MDIMNFLPQRAASKHIQSVILRDNGNVQVYDEHGEEMPDLQGQFEDVVVHINAVYSGDWSYAHGSDAPIRACRLPQTQEDVLQAVIITTYDYYQSLLMQAAYPPLWSLYYPKGASR